MNSLRAFISGIALPSVVLPIFLCFALHFHKEALLREPFIHYIPVIWGIWNVLYFLVCRHILPGDENQKLFLTGASLGLLIAYIGVFWIKMPETLGFTGGLAYLPLIGAPIVYAILWRFVVKPLNSLVGL